MTKSRGFLPPRHQWTHKQVAMLQAQYPHQRTADLAKVLGIDVKLVYAKASRIFKGGILGKATQFKPGQTVWNAGVQYQAGGRCAETQFKPGDKPHTTMPVGSYRVVVKKRGPGYQQLERKTSEASGANHKRWTPVTRLVWESANGPVPCGCIVVFKPGQRTVVLEQITLDRLECITRRENAHRNHPNRSNPELAKLIQLKGAITRQVNRINREHQEQTSP